MSCTGGEPVETATGATLPEVPATRVHAGFEEKITLMARVEAETRREIRTASGGDVETIYVRPGDRVEEGQLLVRINNETVEEQYLAAKTALDNAKVSLEATESVAKANIASAEASKNLAEKSVPLTEQQSSASKAQSIENARNQLESAEQRLNQALESNEQTLSESNANAEVNLELARISYNSSLEQAATLRKQAANQLASAELQVELSDTSTGTSISAAEDTLEQIKELVRVSEIAAQDQIDNAVSNVFAQVRQSALTFDEILGVSDNFDSGNDTFEYYLGVKDPNSKREAEFAMLVLLESLEQYPEDPTADEARELVAEAQETGEKLKIALDNSLTGLAYPQSLLSQHLSAVTGQITTLNGMSNSINTAITTLEQTKTNNTQNLLSAEQGLENAIIARDNQLQQVEGVSLVLENAKISYDSTIEQAETLQAQAKQQLKLAEKSYEDTLARARLQARQQEEQARLSVEDAKDNLEQVIDLASAQLELSEENVRAQLEQAKAALTSSKENAKLQEAQSENALSNAQSSFTAAEDAFEDLEITAPFAGVITQVEVVEGDTLSGNTLVLVLEEEQAVRMSVGVSVETAQLMEKGDEVLINERYFDEIDAIATHANPQTGKIIVEIAQSNADLIPGTMVPIEFTLSPRGLKQDSPYVSLEAVVVEGTESYVWVVTEGVLEKRQVTLGDVEGTVVEVLAGLDTGEYIAADGGRLFEDSDQGREIQLLFE